MVGSCPGRCLRWHAGALGFGDTEPLLREGYHVRNAATGLAVLATLVSSLAGFAQSAVAQAADLSHVSGWATLGSVTPAAGCSLDASIEVREADSGISDVAVGVNLVHDSEVVWADWGMTGADGLAYLSVDTSWAAPGTEAWMDVLIGGEYAGGMPVSITDSGGCADNPDMVELSADVPRRPAERRRTKLEHIGLRCVRCGASRRTDVRTGTQSELRVRGARDGHGEVRCLGLRVRPRRCCRLV